MRTESKPKSCQIKLKLGDIQDAHNRIKNNVVITPVLVAKHIGQEFCNVILKCENLQNTGSFKARGACNVITSMSPSDKSKGITVSGGRNHVLAMVHYGFRQSVPINVVVPKDCPLLDKQQFKENLAIVKVHGNDFNEASLHAVTYSDEIGTTYVHGRMLLEEMAGHTTVSTSNEMCSENPPRNTASDFGPFFIHSNKISKLTTMGDSEKVMEHPHILSFNEIKQAAIRLEGGIIHTPLSKTMRAEAKPKSCQIKLKLGDIQDAHNRIKNNVVITPVLVAKHIGQEFCNVILKCENLQNTGSFKARGACNVITSMSPSDKSKGITVSGGRNHVLAMVHYGFRQSVPINVVVPKDCPLLDKQQFKENLAIVKVHGNDFNEASLHAVTYSDEIGTTYVHGSDRLDLIAGYGTLGLELLTQLEQMDAIICPVGCGDLVAGLILAVKSLKPSCIIYGVECSAAPTMTRALTGNKPVLIQIDPTIADSVASHIASNNAYHIIKGYLDRMITVDEIWISRAMINLLEREKLVVEGAAACSVAALMAGKVPELRGKNVVCVITGGNINSTRMSRVIDRGMAAEGRLVKFHTTLADVPGAMARLLTKVTDFGADVKSFVPERAWMRHDIFNISVNMLIETSCAHHAKELEKKLWKDYPNSSFNML